MELRSLFVRIKGDTSDLEQKLGRTNSLVDKFKQGVAMGAGFGLFHQATTAIGGVSSAAIKLSADYEQSMNLLQATSGATAAEMEALQQTAKSLGSDMSLPGTSAADATVAMLELNKAGLSLNDTMSAARGVLQLSAAAQIDNATAAVMVGDALNTFSLKGSEATRVADLLAGSSLAASGEIGDMSSALQQVGSVAAQANIPIETTMALISLLAKNGIKGSDAGTSTKTFLQRLQSQTFEAREEIERLGVTIYDSQGRMLSMDSIIQQFSTSLGKLTEKDRADALNTIFGADAVRAAGIFFKEGADGLNTMTDAVSRQGSAAMMAEAQMKGFKGSVEGLRSAAESLAINALEPLLPILTSLVTNGAELVGWLAERAGPAAQRMADTLITAASGAEVLSGWIGDHLVPILGTATVGLGAYAVAQSAAFISSLGGLSGAFNILGAGLGLVITRAPAAAAALGSMAIAAGAITIALGATYLAFEKFEAIQAQITEGSAAVVEQSRAYQAENAALQNYSANAVFASDKTKVLAEEVRHKQEALKWATEEYVRYASVGALTEEQEREWLDLLTQGKDRLQEKSSALNESIAADEKAAEASRGERQALADQLLAANALRSGERDATQTSDEYAAALQQTASAAWESDEAHKEYLNTLERITQQGTSAFLGVTSGFADYFDGAARSLEEHNQRIAELQAEKLDADTEAQRTAIDKRITAETQSYNDQAVAQALAYANQRQAQRQHLGEMLLDWINNERAKLAATQQLTPEMEARFAQLTTFTKEQYGLMGTGLEEGFGQILLGFQGVINGTITDLDALKTATQQTEDHFSKVELRARELEREYVAQVLIESKGESPEEIGRRLEEAKKKAYIQAELDVTEVENKEARLQEVVNRIPNHLQSQLFLDVQEWDPVADAALLQKESLASPVQTTMSADGATAVSEAERIQAVYDRMDRKIDTIFDADPTRAVDGASTVTNAVQSTPESHTTQFFVDASSVAPDMQAAAQNAVDTFAFTLAAGAAKAAAAAHTMARGATAGANRALGIASPSKEFQEIGRFIDEGLALGVAEHADKPTQAVENLGEKLVSAHERYLDDLDTATQRFAETQAEIWDRYYADLAEQTERFNGNKFDDQLDFYDQIAGLDSAAREAAMQRQREAWDLSQQMAQEGRAAEAEEYYNAALEEIEADTRRAEKLAAIDEDLAQKRQQLAEEQDAARKAALEAEIKELESREQYLKEVDEQRDARAAERLERLRNEESAIAEERDESLSEAQKSYNDTVKDIETRFLDSFNSVREGIGGVADSTESAAASIIAAYNRITAAAQSAASSAASSAATTSSTSSSDAIPLGSYALGTGDRGLPGDGLFYGHKEEIIANPDQSDAIRDSGGIEQVIAKARSYDDLDGSFQPQRSGRSAAGFTGAAASQTFILEKLADTLIIKDEMDIEVIAAQVVQRIKRRMH